MSFDVLAELEAHGTERFTPEEAYAWCRTFTKQRASNFYYASTILPPRKRNAIYAAYAFSGYVDDIADELTDRSRQEAGDRQGARAPGGLLRGRAPGSAVHRAGRRRRSLRNAARALRGAGQRRGDGLHHQPLRDLGRSPAVLLPGGLDGWPHLRLHLRGQTASPRRGVRDEHGPRPADREHHARRQGRRRTRARLLPRGRTGARTASRPTTSSPASTTRASSR